MEKNQITLDGRESPQALPQVGNFEVLDAPTKRESDRKQYKVIRLENGVTACLISDLAADGSQDKKFDSDSSESESEGTESATDTSESEDESEDHDKRKGDEGVKLASVSLCVGVGSFSEPKEVPGLAHFLEHLVSMGSKKFPKENDFYAYIQNHGGSANASTYNEKTTYYFTCLEKYLYKSMDKFVQFFISPLMTKESMIREREAVESEFQNSITSDACRKEQLLISLAKESSPVNNFSWGNMKTLHDNVEDDTLYNHLHEFKAQNYSANRMTVAVKARLSMEILERYVVDCFSQVDNNNSPTPDFTFHNDAFNTPQFKKAYYIEPLRNLNEVELTWMLPPTQHLFRSKPAYYVSWLLLHEGPGSLLSYLRNKLWALAIYGKRNYTSSSFYTHFSVNITLTAEGLLHLTDVVQAVFGYIRMLKEVLPDERIFKELQLITDAGFCHSSLESLSKNMHCYPPKYYLTGSQLLFAYEPEEIANIVNALVPEYMNMIVMASGISKQMNYDQVEPWFNTKYCALDFEESWMKMWNDVARMPEFYLPNPNSFITDDFSLVKDDSTSTLYPVKILDSPLAELWYKMNNKYKIAYYKYYFCTPLAVKSIKNACLLDIFLLMLNANFVEEGYDAIISGITIELTAMDKGFYLGVSGCTLKLPVLINTIAQYMVNVGPSLKKDLFNLIKEKLGKNYYNKILDPSIVGKELRLSILQHNYYTVYDKKAVLDEVTFDDMKNFSSELFKNLYVKCLVQGNVESSTAVDTTNQLINNFNCTPIESADFLNMLVHEIPNGEHCCRVMSFNKQSPTSVITNYYQTGLLTVKNKAIADIVMFIIENPLFDNLRTKEQLGYTVFRSISSTYDALGFSISVLAQINKYKTDYIDSRIEEFLQSQYMAFKSKGKKKFTTAQRVLMQLKQRVVVCLEEEVDRHWEEIILSRYMFDRLDQEVKVIEAMKMSEVQEWWYEHITSEESEFRKITFQVVGHPSSSDGDNKASTSVLANIDHNSIEDVIEVRKPEAFKLEMLQDVKQIQNNGDHYFIQDVEDFRRNLPLVIGKSTSIECLIEQICLEDN